MKKKRRGEERARERERQSESKWKRHEAIDK